MNKIKTSEPSDCVICCSDCEEPIAGSSASWSSFCTNSLRGDDDYSSENLAESFCQLLHLPLSAYKERFIQANIYFCKSCAISAQRIHVALNQLKTLQLELNELKIQFHNSLKKCQNSGIREKDAEWTHTPTTSLRIDVINELKLSRLSDSEETLPTNTHVHNFEDILTIFLPPTTEAERFVNNEEERERRVVLAAGTIVGNVFKEEMDESSNGANQSIASEQDESHQDHSSSSGLRKTVDTQMVAVRTRRRSQRRQPRSTKQDRQAVRSVRRPITGNRKDRTLVLKLTRLEDEGISYELRRDRKRRNVTKLVDSSDVCILPNRDDRDVDEKDSLPEPTERANTKPKRALNRNPRKSNCEYLLCPKEACPYKFIIRADDRAGAEIRRDAHVKRIHEGIKCPFSCSECSKTFGTRQQHVEHSRIHTGETPYICEVCGKGFRSSHLLQFHLKIHDRTGGPSFCCELCPDKFFNAPTLTTHMLTHTKERAFVCELCSASFLRNHDLKNHQRFAHSEVLGLEQYKCRFCDKVVAKKLSLIDHEKTHTKDGKFKCSICDYRSNVRSRVRIHERSHTLERTYKCDECDKSYKHEFILEIHKRSHTGERPFKCKVCGTAFKARSHMYIHEQTHGDLKHKCSFCGQGFTLKKYMLRHEDRHKNGKLQKRWKWPKEHPNPVVGESLETEVRKPEPQQTGTIQAQGTEQVQVANSVTNNEPIFTTIDTVLLFERLNVPTV